MELITSALAKRDFQNGYLQSFLIIREQLGDGWQMIFIGANGEKSTLVDAHDKRMRVFKTIDAALREAGRIGFKVSALAPANV